MDEQRYKNMQEFWPFYVREHTRPVTRWLNFVGTSTIFAWAMAAIIRREPKLLFLSVISPYAFAWVSHLFVEHNRPATFKYPVKSLLADFIMYGKIWQGQMNREVARYTSPETDS